MLTIVDYGLGNKASVVNMLSKVGAKDVKIATTSSELKNASKLILPGVGAFDSGVTQLHNLKMFSVIDSMVKDGVPILGICLGMQLLAQNSEEGQCDGFGFIQARFKNLRRFDQNIKIPHVGWNIINVVRDCPLYSSVDGESRFYFTHSYYAQCDNVADVVATVDYGKSFPVFVHNKNIYGVQFHPEKSHRFGMTILKKFSELKC